MAPPVLGLRATEGTVKRRGGLTGPSWIWKGAMLLAIALVLLVASASAAFALPVTVRRFYCPANGNHLWSADGQECANVLQTLSGTYSYEGISWTIEGYLAGSPLYRAYNTRTGGYFYTITAAEYNGLPSYYNKEGIAYYVSANYYSGYGTVYRAYNRNTGVHFYTADPAEYAGLPSYFTKEGISFWFPTAITHYNMDRGWAQTNSTWPKFHVYVDYTGLPADWTAAVTASLAQWNNVGASQMYFYSDYAPRGQRLYLYWDPAGVYVLGQTLANHTPIDSCWTRINTAFVMAATPPPNSALYDGQSVITHELGHWVHEFDDDSITWYPELHYMPWATMTAYATPGSTDQRTLATEDIDALRALYGRKP